MFRFNKPEKNRRSASASARAKQPNKGRLLELGVLATFLLVVLYIISVSVRITTGVSETLDSPEHVVRLQILNGCGVNGLASKVADALADYSDPDLEIEVIDTDNFDLRKVTRTFLISRQKDERGGTILAEKIGLDPSEIVFEPLENNYRQVSVTLILGEDWETLKLLNNSGREK